MMVPEACLDILNSHTTQISSTFWTLWINETCMVWTCHKPWQPLQNQPSAVQSTLEGGQCHGQQRKCWINNIKKWTSLPMSEPPMPELPKVASRKKQNKQKKKAESSIMSLWRPNKPWNSTELNLSVSFQITSKRHRVTNFEAWAAKGSC